MIYKNSSTFLFIKLSTDKYNKVKFFNFLSGRHYTVVDVITYANVMSIRN